MQNAELKETGRAKRSEEIVLPAGVTATISGRLLALKGPEGETSKEIKAPSVSIAVESNRILLEAGKDSKLEKKLLGSLRAHVVNMIVGVTEGHTYKLKICFTHFPITATVSGRKFIVKNFLGEKTPRQIELPEDVKVRVEGADVTVESASRESAGQVAASIEQATRRANYDTRVFADGIYITMKDGKDIK